MPGIGLVIEGAMQQAPHCGRHGKGAGMIKDGGVVEGRQYTPLPGVHRGHVAGMNACRLTSDAVY